MKKILSLVLAVMMVVTFIAGCTSDEPSPSAQEQEPAESLDSETPAPANNDETSELVLAWFFPAPHPYGDAVQEGVRKFENETGISVIQQIGSDWTQSTMNTRVEALAAQGIDGLAAFPADAAGTNALFEELTNQGIKVLTYGAPVMQPTTASFAVATDVKQAAYDATKYLIQLMGEEGNILNVLEVLVDPNTVLRKEGVELAVSEYPNVNIIQEVADITTTEEAVLKIEAALSANVGQIDGIITTGFIATVGAVQVLTDFYERTDMETNKIFAIGIDTDPIINEAIEKGILDATISQNPVGHGYIPLYILRLMIEQDYRPRAGTYFIDAGTVVVTRDNLDSFQADIDMVTERILARLTTDYLER